ncbi:MAG: anti-sigma factor [Methylobacterium sp.]|uniref:anti-sigma factor n=1 Tax=Methylobacterium sp. TaxID=409 RepID=UPI0025D75B6C|nr:anti-sigma factor [Methylobacterium sp.]MBX9931085.1 anti-sigma factor [Methylobacterium sp.]
MSADPNERDLRAAEYVLGTLSASERAALDLERAVDPATEAAVRAWERRLSPLDDTIQSVEPPERVWQKILRALPGRSASAPANDNRIEALSRQIRLWRGAALTAGALAASLALVVALGRFGAPPVTPADTRYVAVVSRGGEVPAFLVSVDLAAGTAQVRPVGAETPAGHSLELWYVEGGTPKTLGVIGASARKVALPADAKAAQPGAGLFAVSVEPPGGSPTGKPTGPVIYSGTLIKD